jgi:regulator of protease activity HflC (stomatin/prohibitin superfamily)
MSEMMQKTWLFRLKKEITIYEYERGLFYKEGKLEELLEPGRYQWWRWERVDVTPVSTRQMSEVVSGQAILTSDRIEVRVSLVAQYSIADPVLAINSVASYSDQLYQDLQLVLRDLVASRELDALLDDRNEIADALLAGVKEDALAYGIDLKRVGVRDIVLPGVVRNVFLKEVEADREGRAELVKARHEVAAARARANTAKIMSENPNIQRMQEIEALVKIAGRNGSMVLLPAFSDLLSRMGQTTPSNGNGNGNGKSG